jgi:Protein of unknown function (DUF3307)
MTILDAIILLLVLLQLKHWYIDFVDQDMEEVNHKGIFLHWLGMKHSLKQGFGTYICIAAVVGAENWIYALVLGLFDFVTHYIIDWMKMNWGNRDIQTPAFWAHLGLDQMLHQITYLWIVYMVVS